MTSLTHEELENLNTALRRCVYAHAGLLEELYADSAFKSQLQDKFLFHTFNDQTPDRVFITAEPFALPETKNPEELRLLEAAKACGEYLKEKGFDVDMNPRDHGGFQYRFDADGTQYQSLLAALNEKADSLRKDISVIDCVHKEDNAFEGIGGQLAPLRERVLELFNTYQHHPEALQAIQKKLDELFLPLDTLRGLEPANHVVTNAAGLEGSITQGSKEKGTGGILQ